MHITCNYVKNGPQKHQLVIWELWICFCRKAQLWAVFCIESLVVVPWCKPTNHGLHQDCYHADDGQMVLLELSYYMFDMTDLKGSELADRVETGENIPCLN